MRVIKIWSARQQTRISVLPSIVAAIVLAGCGEPGPKALLNGERLIREQQFDKAIEQLRAATKHLPRNPQAWNHLGVAYHGAGQPEQALRHYRQAISIDMNLAPAKYNLGVL